MEVTKEQKNEAVTLLLNGTISSFKNVVPLSLNIDKPKRLETALQLEFGVLIGFTGDIKGKLILAGDTTVFSNIGESMFGMSVEGEMLSSFSGELGNMIAGGLSTNIDEKGISTDITSPTIMQGKTYLTGFDRALQVPILIEKAGDLVVYFLLD